MTALVVLSVLWVVTLLSFLAVMIYRAHLTNMETDQLFLSDTNGTAAVHLEQDMIVHRVQALAPLVTGLTVGVAALTISIMATYIVQVILPNSHLS